MYPISRKTFILLLPVLAGIGMIWLWRRSVNRFQTLSEKKNKYYFDAAKGTAYKADGVIFIQHGTTIRAFSDRCTHLGCKLNVLADGTMVCPCHGSAFSNAGKVMKGPAGKDLDELPVFWDTDKQQYFTVVIADA
ncbi:MAG: ubiquinol-cytochrome c reductase iron-sulfur subunit [Bacteroidales bacterium]